METLTELYAAHSGKVSDKWQLFIDAKVGPRTEGSLTRSIALKRCTIH